MRFQLKLIFAFTLLCFATSSFSQGFLSFPEDSARWYLEKNTPSKTGCDRSFIRYYSKGDTVVGSAKYHKVYRQTSLDSTLFPDSKDTLRMFMRMSSDSQKVIMRFVDSINGYGISEHIVGDFAFKRDPKRDTLYRPITANNKKREQVVVQAYPDDLYGCNLVFDKESVPVSFIYMPLIERGNENSTTQYILNFFSSIGEREKSWFATDLDSAGIYSYKQPQNCKNVSASLYKMDIRFENNGKYQWYNMNLDCTVGLNLIKSNSTQTKIFPNPFSTSFKVQHSESIKSLKLIDATGKVFLDKTYNSIDLEKTIKLESLKPGIYFLIVNDEYSKKVMKY